MARVTDKNKLKSIKAKFVDLIVEHGISGTSISKVAKEAKVSVGYLYTYYDSKENLLLDVYKDKFYKINEILTQTINSYDKLEDFVFNFYSNLVKFAFEYENEILFLLKMMTDYSIKISDEIREEVITSINFFKNKFDHEINQDIKNEQLFIQILGTFLIFINLRKRKILSEERITKEDIKQITKMTVNSLK